MDHKLLWILNLQLHLVLSPQWKVIPAMKVYLYPHSFCQLLLIFTDVTGDSVPGEVQSSVRGSVFLQLPDEEQRSQDEQVSKDIERLVYIWHVLVFCLYYRDNWYYQLCVLEWVLHAMQLSTIHFMPPFSKCWNVEMWVKIHFNWWLYLQIYQYFPMLGIPLLVCLDLALIINLVNSMIKNGTNLWGVVP